MWHSNSLSLFPGSMNVLLASSAQFFVAMGVLTMIYVGGAIVVYVLFITPELYLAKWIVIGVRVYELWGGLSLGYVCMSCGGDCH